jgi:hypothetical protein
MRIRVLTSLIGWLLCGSVLAQGTGAALHADRVLVLKKERTLQLLSEGKVIKTYKIALGGEPVGPKTKQGITRLQKAFTFSTHETCVAGFTSRFIFRIPTRAIVQRRAGRELRRAAMYSFMDCPRDSDM